VNFANQGDTLLFTSTAMKIKTLLHIDVAHNFCVLLHETPG